MGALRDLGSSPSDLSFISLCSVRIGGCASTNDEDRGNLPWQIWGIIILLLIV